MFIPYLTQRYIISFDLGIKKNSTLDFADSSINDKSNARTSFGDLKSKLFLGLFSASLVHIFPICCNLLVGVLSVNLCAGNG